MIFAIQYWLLVVGFNEESGMRFDTMENHWRIASSTLSVLWPIVALGLWGMYAWGPAIWLMGVLIEFIMYVVNPELFGARNLLISFHALTVSFYLVILLLEKIKKGGSRETA